jgi:hypothetical protein
MSSVSKKNSIAMRSRHASFWNAAPTTRARPDVAPRLRGAARGESRGVARGE